MDERPEEIRRRTRIEGGREPAPVEGEEIRERALSGDEVAKSRAEIEHTRADMSETVDALQERLSPQNLKEQAKVQAKDTAREAGSGFVETIRQNPIPAAMVGIGLGWLLTSAGKQTSSGPRYQEDRTRAYAYHPPEYDDRFLAEERRTGGSSVSEGVGQARDRLGEAAGLAQERASEVGDRAQYQAQRAKGGFQNMLQDNPFAVGAVAVGIGAAVGFSTPETRKENEVMGEARDNLVERGKEKAQDVKDRAQRVAEEGRRAAREEAENQDLTSE